MARSVDAGVDSDQGPGRSLQWVTRSDSIVQLIVKVEEVAVQVQVSDHLFYYVSSLDFVLFQLVGADSWADHLPRIHNPIHNQSTH
jgi:hypothetical protein